MASLLKVSSQSNPAAVAGAIAGVMRSAGYVEVQAIGASAVNQAIKAIAIARDHLSRDMVDLVTQPSFQTVYIDGQERTAIHFAVFRRVGTQILRPIAEATPEATY